MSKKQPRRKHVPQRTCVVCRKTDAKRTLTRFVRTADEGVHLDPSGKRNGRGAYACAEIACWQEALHAPTPEKACEIAMSILEKALRTTLSIEDQNRIRAAMLPDN